MSEGKDIDLAPQEAAPRRGLLLLAVFAAALLVRCAIAWRSEIINTDGPIYLAQARSFLAGEVRAGVQGSFYAPVTSAGIAVVAWLGVPLETAGYFFCALCGALAVFPLHAIARRGFGIGLALATVWLYAFLPVAARLEAQVYSTGPFVLFAACSMALATRLLETPSLLAALGSGAAVAVAYATRVDGLILLPFAIVAALLARARVGRRVALAACAVLPVCAAVFVYGWTAGTEAGVWFTKKLDPSQWSRFCAPVLPPFSMVGLLWEDLAEALFVPFVPFAAAGLLLARGPRGRRLRALVAVLSILWLACLLKLCATTGQSSKRYTTPIAVLLLPWVAQGVLSASRGVARLARGRERVQAATAATFVVLACAGCIPKLLKLHEGNRISEKRAGELLRTLPGPTGPILCGGSLVPFYADRPTVPAWWARLAHAEAFRRMRAKGVTHIVLDRGLRDLAPGFAETLEGPDAVLVAEVPSTGGARIRIFRMESPRKAARTGGAGR